jgi:hypothetical protein
MWVNCHVEKVGPAEDREIYVALRADDGSFNHWFKAHPNIRRDMLSTALFALIWDKQVTVALTSTAEYSTVERLYIVK